MTRYPFRTSIRFPPVLLNKIDAFAEENGMTRGGAVRYLAGRQLKYLTEDGERRRKGILRAYYKPDADRFTDSEISAIVRKLREKYGPKITKGQVIYNLLRTKKEQRGPVKSRMLKGMDSLEVRVKKVLGDGAAEDG